MFGWYYEVVNDINMYNLLSDISRLSFLGLFNLLWSIVVKCEGFYESYLVFLLGRDILKGNVEEGNKCEVGIFCF